MKIHAVLCQEGFPESFLAKYRKSMLTYVKAVESISSYNATPSHQNEDQYHVSYNTLLNAQALDHDKIEEDDLIFRMRSDEATTAACDCPQSEDGDSNSTISLEEPETDLEDDHASQLPRSNDQEAENPFLLCPQSRVWKVYDWEDDTKRK